MLERDQVVFVVHPVLRAPVGAAGGVGPALIQPGRIRGVDLYTGERAQRQAGPALPSGFGLGHEGLQVQLPHGQQAVPDGGGEGTARIALIVVPGSVQLTQIGQTPGQGERAQRVPGIPASRAQPQQHPLALRHAQATAEFLMVRIVDLLGPHRTVLRLVRAEGLTGYEESIREVTGTGDDGPLPACGTALFQGAHQIHTAPADERRDMLRRAEAPTLAQLEHALITLRTEAQLPPPASRLALLRTLQTCLDPQIPYRLDASAHDWLQRLRTALTLDAIAELHPDKDNNAGLDELAGLCQTKNLALQDLAQGEEVIGKILLTTYHSAKGREFDTVILPGLLNGIIPRNVPERGAWRPATPKELAEQQRTFYVALTRAENTLHLIYGPGYHTRNGYWRPDGPSAFLIEMYGRLSPADAG